MPTYGTLTFVLGLMLTVVQFIVLYVMPETPKDNWWIVTGIMLILTVVASLVVGKVGRRNQDQFE